MPSTEIKTESEIKRHRLFFRVFLPLTLILAILVPLWSLNGLLLFLVLMVYFIFVLAFFNNKWGLFLFIILRPALDFSTNDTVIQLGNFNLNFAAILGIAILIFTVWILFKQYARIKRSPILILWIIFLLINVVSLFVSLDLSTSLAELARLLTIFSLFLLGFILIKDNNDLTKLIKVVIFSSLIPAISAFIQLLSHSGLKDGNDIRIYGTFAHPNMLAFFLCFTIVLTVFIFLNNNRRHVSSLMYTLLMIFEFILLIFTYTRGAWLVLLIFLGIIGLLHFRKFLLASLIVLGMLYLVITPFQARVNTLIQPDPYGSISWRMDLWEDAYSYIKKEPLIGHGAGTASLVIADNRGPKLGSPEPHNDYLRLGLDTGILGLVSYLFLILALLFNLVRCYQQQQKPRLKMFNLFMLSFAVALFIMSFGDNILNDTALQWSLWALVGALISLQVKLKKTITI